MKRRNPEAKCKTCIWWEPYYVDKGGVQRGNCTGAPGPRVTAAEHGCGIHQDAIIEDTPDENPS